MRGERPSQAGMDRERTAMPLTLEVQCLQSCHPYWQYAWDQSASRLRLVGLQPAQVDLPADQALFLLEGQIRVPVYVLTPVSIAPGTDVTVRVLGAFQLPPTMIQKAEASPLAGFHLLVVPAVAGSLPLAETLAELPETLLRTLYTHAATQSGLSASPPATPFSFSPALVEQRLREARRWLKQMQRQQGRSQRSTVLKEEETPVAWRAVEAFTPAERAQVAQARTREELIGLLQPEQLIRFVPQRFQHTLRQLLLDDEHLLAFLERPHLSRRTGWLGLQPFRANAGLLLVTDRQLLWVRDFFAPGSLTFPEGYIAYTVPLERLVGVSLLPADQSALAQRMRLEEDRSPYQRLVLESLGRHGRACLEVAFPATTTNKQALEQIIPLLQAFFPDAEQNARRLRRLPVVDAWLPQGTEARRLAGLGGSLPGALEQRLTQQLEQTLAQTREELLLSTTVPALEEYRSPARLVALTRKALFVIDTVPEKMRWAWQTPPEPTLVMQCYRLADISSAQLSYSLFGASLRLFLPHSQEQGTSQVTIPFQSPAIVRFLPLFTRLRLLLGMPFPLVDR
jgi:hypothetical protein